MHVCVIGAGYLGLVTGVCLAHIGHQVICVDNNQETVKRMQAGQSPIVEPGLSELMQGAIADQRIEFTTDLAAGVIHGDILLIAGMSHEPIAEQDTHELENIAWRIGSHLQGDYKIIVNKLTQAQVTGNRLRMMVLDGMLEQQQALVPVGVNTDTTLNMVDFDVVSHPEFLRQGSAVHDMFNPDRIVLEGNSSRAIAVMQQLYAPIISREYAENKTLPTVPVLVTDLSFVGKQVICS